MFYFYQNMNYNDIYTSLSEYIKSHVSNYVNSVNSITRINVNSVNVDKINVNCVDNECYKIDFKKLLYHSYHYERDVEKLTDDIKESVYKYLKSLSFHEPPSLMKLNELLKINDDLRTIRIYVSTNNCMLTNNMLDEFDEHFSCKHIGMLPNDLKTIESDNYLQNMINTFYENLHEDITLDDLMNGFYNYIKFELIHPFIDGNGRLGRLIFLEHPFGYNLFPFSEIVDKLSIDQNMIFKSVNLRFDNKHKQCYSIDDYLNCVDRIDMKTKLNILKIIYKVVCYKQFSNIDERYSYRIKTILKTRIENVYDKYYSTTNCYDYDTILTIICPDIHNELM